MRTRLRHHAAVLAFLVGAAACGGAPPIPKRGVVEGDLGGWHFRRFQPVLDVEVWVEDNPAEAFTASYVTARAEKLGKIADSDLVNVFVTRYERDDGVVRELARFVRRLAADSGYQATEREIEDVRLVELVGNGEYWVIWAAPRHVVKVGGRARTDVPDDVVEAYGERYPSRVPGGILEGPLPPGPAPKAPEGGDEDAPYDPDAPRPDWDGYEPGKAPPPTAGDDDE